MAADFEATVREILDTPGGDPIYKLHCIKTALNEIDAAAAPEQGEPEAAVEGAEASEGWSSWMRRTGAENDSPDAA